MASLSTKLTPLSIFSPLKIKQHPNLSFSKRVLVPHKKRRTLILAVHENQGDHDIRTRTRTSWWSWTKLPLSDIVVVSRKKRAFWERKWDSWDVFKVVTVFGSHLLSLLAPFHFNWTAFKVSFWTSIMGGICITLSYHRNLAHRSFDLPKWLEYLFAYGALLAFQGDPIEWVSIHRYHHKHCETQLDPHTPKKGFWFSHIMWIFHTTSILQKKRTFLAVHENQGDHDLRISWSSWTKLPLSDIAVVRRKTRAFWERRRKYWDVTKVVIIVGSHLLSLLAPFHFNLTAIKVSFWIHLIGGICITLSYHRNLAHRSFDLPKWLEYLFAYGALLAFQGDPIEWVSIHRYHHKHCDTKLDPHTPKKGFWFSHIMWLFDTTSIFQKCGREENVEDLVRQPFYRFLQRTMLLHMIGFVLVHYLWGGLPFLTWGIGVASVIRYHVTFLVNSVCHTWGTRAWNTPDLSKNNWWVGILALGEGWHNNHHAFEFSARHGLKWWQFDLTWYLIRFLELIGLATNVKLPTKAQMKRMALE